MSHTQVKIVEKFEALQALRAIAAAFVVYVHAQSTYAEKIAPLGYMESSIGLGDIGVKLFFCISGFIIFRSAGDLSTGFASVCYFFRRRLIRVVPMYWIATAIYAVKLSLQGNPPLLGELVMSLLFWPFSLANGLMRPVLGVGWTLNYEIFFYVLLALTLFLNRIWRLPLIVLAMVFLVALKQYLVVNNNFEYLANPLALLSDVYLLFFVAGALVTLIPKWLPDSAKTMSYVFVNALLFIVGLVFWIVFYKLNLSFSSSFGLFAELLLISTCVLVCVLARPASGGLTSMLARIGSMAGDGSYATYLFHGFIMGASARLLAYAGVSGSPYVFSFVMVIVASAIGVALHVCLEKPISKVLNNNWGRY